MKLYRKIFLLTILCVVVLLYSTDAYAVDILQKTAEKVTKAFKETKGVVLVLGGFGLVGVTYYAIFGKVKWSWLAGILVGLAVLSATGALVYYATEGGARVSSSAAGGNSSDIFAFFSGRAINFAIGLRNIAFCLSGFGIIMFTFAAISGKINFKHLGYIFISFDFVFLESFYVSIIRVS